MDPVLAVRVTVPPPAGNVGHCPLADGRWVGALPPGPPGITVPLLDPLPLEPLELVELLPVPLPLLLPSPVPPEEPLPPEGSVDPLLEEPPFPPVELVPDDVA
jgi:hypothetical protein